MGPSGWLPSSPKNIDEDVGVFDSAPFGYPESSQYLLLQVQGEHVAKDLDTHFSYLHKPLDKLCYLPTDV
jgi:hypothetical protein